MLGISSRFFLRRKYLNQAKMILEKPQCDVRPLKPKHQPGADCGPEPSGTGGEWARGSEWTSVVNVLFLLWPMWTV